MRRQVVENVGKLPKWAQRKIEILEMRLREAKDTLARLGGAEPTNTIVREPFATDTNLPDYSHIEFKPKAGNPIEVYLRSDDDEGIIVSSSRSGGLRVMPWATNVVKIYVVE